MLKVRKRMENRTEREGICSPEREQEAGLESLVDQIQAIAAYDARHSDGEIQLTKQLKSWWSRTYNRPLKDPLLLSYTLEELLYEYYDHIERDKYAGEIREEETDRIDRAKAQKSEDWADEMEREEEEEEERQRLEAEKATAAKPVDPNTDPENIKWMEEQIKKDKEKFGEDFGEDLKLEF